MSHIKYIDTDGNKSRLLPFRYFGLDNYTSGNDVGRVYIGTGTENIPLAKKSEVTALADEVALVDDTKLPKTNPSITGSITEQVYNLTGSQINPANGTIQYKTVGANTTFTVTLTSGQSVLLRLINANTRTITFPTITWVGGAAPELTANCAIVLWKEQSTLYGAFVGSFV